MHINKYKIRSNIYLFFLLAFSGNPFFNLITETGRYFFSAIVLILVLLNYSFFSFKSIQSRPFFIYVFLYVLIFLLQFINLDFISLAGGLGFILKITFGYILIRSIGENFREFYLNVIYFICLISLAGFSLNLIGVNIPNFLQNSGPMRSVIIYTQNASDANLGVRNSGMFWEPGAFSGYICLLFLLYLRGIRNLIKQHKLKIMVIFIALLTTFSTTGYVVIFLIGLLTILFEFSSRSGRLMALAGVFAFVVIGINLFGRLPFLGEKVSQQFEMAGDLEGDFSNTRFGAFMFDIHYIKKNPLTGNGLHEKTRYADHPWLHGEQLGHGNGFSNFIASMGILGFLIFAWYLIKFNTISRWAFFVGVITLLQGEQLLNFPLFLSLPFVFVYGIRNSRSPYLP